MKHLLLFAGVLAASAVCVGNFAFGRGFGGFHGGGGMGGAMGGMVGGFHGGFGGGGMPGGLGGGGMDGFAGGLGGGAGERTDAGGGGGFGFGGGGGFGFGGGGGGGGFGFGGGGGAGGLEGGAPVGGLGGGRLSGFEGGGLGPASGMRGAGLPGGLGARGLGAGGFAGGDGPSASRLGSFLGLPTDGGISAAGAGDLGGRFSGISGSARGLSPLDASGASGNVWHGPNGATIAHGSAGERGGVIGPNGGAAGERGASGTVVKGPDGGVYAHGQAGGRGVVDGPGGIAAGGREASGTVIKGAGDNTIAHGQASSRGFYDGARGVGTWHCSAADMRIQGNYVRGDFHRWDAFGRDWYRRYPGAWWARGFAAGVWTAATWGAINDWFAVDWPAVGYDYGDNITYGDDTVYLNGEPMASTADYYQSAASLAQTGAQANVQSEATGPGDDDPFAPSAQADPQWLPLGVFEAVPGNEKSSKMVFQLAVNKDGIVRGNYYNTGDNNVQQVEGAVDKQTQRVTWTVADRKNVIFDTGLYNLTKDEATVLVHESADQTEQWTLVRLQQPPAGAQSTDAGQ